ncbi:ATP-grasp domain-containing protein, partial [bacterium]|nr:ATP-grasp domain-containing protein [bacterium]
MKLIVINGPDQLSSNLYLSARKQNIDVVTFSDSNSVGLDYSDKVHAIQGLDVASCLEVVKNNKIKNVIDVVALRDKHVPLVTSLCEKVSSTSNLSGKIRALNDANIKTKLRQGLNNDYFPWWKKVNLNQFEDEVQRALNTYATLIVKPLHGYHGIGVKKISSTDDILSVKNEVVTAIAVLNERFNGFDQATKDDVTLSCILEEYIDSSDYVVDAVISNGKVLFSEFCEKATRSLSYNEDRAYFTAHNLTEKMLDKAKSFLSDLANKYPEFISIVHAEFKIKDDKVKFIDIAFRAGGAGLSDKIHFYSTGVSLYDVWLKALIDKNATAILDYTKKPILLYLGQVKGGGVVHEITRAIDVATPDSSSILFENSFCKVGDVL